MTSQRYGLDRAAAITYAHLGATEADRFGNREAIATFGLYAAASKITAVGLEVAREESLKAWQLFARAPHRVAMFTGLEFVADALALRGEVRRASRLFGAIDALRRRSEAAASRRTLARLHTADAIIRAGLPADEIDAMQMRGTMLPIDEVLHEALLDPV